MLTRSRRTTNNTPPPPPMKSTTQSQCWTILEVFQWIKDTLKKGIGNYVLDVSQKNGVPCHPNGEGFLIEVVNQETSLKYVVLWSNMNTTNTKCQRGYYKLVPKKNRNRNRSRRRQYSFVIDIVNPSEECPPKRSRGQPPIMSPKVNGQIVVLLGIFLAIYLNVTEITLLDEARTEGWADGNGRLLRQVQYEQECTKNNFKLPHEKTMDCFSYYKQFGFRDIVRTDAPLDCHEIDGSIRTVASIGSLFYMHLHLKHDCVRNIEIQEVLNGCFIHLLKSKKNKTPKISDTDQYIGRLKRILYRNAIMDPIKEEECTQNIYDVDDDDNQRQWWSKPPRHVKVKTEYDDDDTTTSHPILGKRKHDDTLPFYRR